MKTKILYKNFGSAIKEIMKEKKVTYENLAKSSNVSRTYLTQILLHGRVPSKEIIEKISKALNIEPILFKEYRVMTIIEDLQKIYWALEKVDIEVLESFIHKMQVDAWVNNDDNEILKGENEIGFYPDYVINLSNLEDNQKKIIKYIYNEFIDSNKEKELEFKIMDEFTKYTKSEEFDSYVEAYRHLSPEDTWSQAYNEFREKYLKKMKRN